MIQSPTNAAGGGGGDDRPTDPGRSPGSRRPPDDQHRGPTTDDRPVRPATAPPRAHRRPARRSRPRRAGRAFRSRCPAAAAAPAAGRRRRRPGPTTDGTVSTDVIRRPPDSRRAGSAYGSRPRVRREPAHRRRRPDRAARRTAGCAPPSGPGSGRDPTRRRAGTRAPVRSGRRRSNRSGRARRCRPAGRRGASATGAGVACCRASSVKQPADRRGTELRLPPGDAAGPSRPQRSRGRQDCLRNPVRSASRLASVSGRAAAPASASAPPLDVRKSRSAPVNR